MGKCASFIVGVVVGVLAYKLYKGEFGELGQEHLADLLDKCQPLCDEGKEFVDRTMKKVSEKFSCPSEGNTEKIYSFTFSSGNPGEPDPVGSADS